MEEKKEKIQVYVSQPSVIYAGKYEIAKYSYKENSYITMKGELYQYKITADERAKKLNKDEDTND